MPSGCKSGTRATIPTAGGPRRNSRRRNSRTRPCRSACSRCPRTLTLTHTLTTDQDPNPNPNQDPHPHPHPNPNPNPRCPRTCPPMRWAAGPYGPHRYSYPEPEPEPEPEQLTLTLTLTASGPHRGRRHPCRRRTWRCRRGGIYAVKYICAVLRTATNTRTYARR